jgi:hypothetical protein
MLRLVLTGAFYPSHGEPETAWFAAWITPATGLAREVSGWSRRARTAAPLGASAELACREKLQNRRVVVVTVPRLEHFLVSDVR